jgi:hypothetical protein
MEIRLGELLLREGAITQQQHQEAVSHQQRVGGGLQRALVSLGFVTDEEIPRFFSRRYGVRWVDLKDFEIDPAIPKMISAGTARLYKVLPLSRSKKTLTVAMADPTNMAAIKDLGFMTGHNIDPVVASERAVEDAISLHYGAPPRALRENTSPDIFQEEEILKPLAQKYGCPAVNLYQFEIDPLIWGTIPGVMVSKYMVVPLRCSGAVLTLAMADPSNVPAIDDIARRTGYSIEPVVASERALKEAIEHHFGPPLPS